MGPKQFLSAMGVKGWLRTNKFRFFINPPSLIEGGDSLASLITLSGFASSWPSMGANFTSYLMDGIQRKTVRDLEYDPITVSFYCNNDGDQWYFFHEWMKGYRDPVTRTPAYYDEYTSKGSRIQALQGISNGMDSNQVPHMDLRINRMFPTHLTGKEFDWSDKNGLWTFDVTFQVDWWEEYGDTGRSRTEGGPL